MTELPLNPEEAEMLEQALSRCVSDLEREIAHTDHAEFRKLLKQRRSVLTAVHARLALNETASPVSAPRL